MEGGEEWRPEVKLGMSGQGKKKGNKRRFSDEQIRLLEMMFEEETKLEPKKKLQAARELGLQPRQVAIWFQNRRARWKSKQLEREYNVLKANYDALAQSCDSLKKEKQSLLKQVKKLSEMLEKPDQKRSSEGSRDCDDDSHDGAATKSEKGEEMLKLSMGDGADFAFSACSVEENSINCIKSFRPDESDMMTIVDPAGAESSSIAWPADWADLDSGSFSDQSCCTMEWWDFWASSV